MAQGATVTLVLSSSGFTWTIAYPEKAPSVVSGSWTSSRDMLSLKPTGMSWSWQFDYSLTGNSLSLSGGSAEFDFSGSGAPEQAKLSMTLVRQ